MADADIAVCHTLKRRPQRRLNGGSAALCNGLDLLFDRLLVRGQCRFHYPAIGIIKGNHAHIIRASHLIYCGLRRRDGQIQIRGSVSGIHTHTSGMVNHHDHRHGRNLIYAPKLHVHRKHRLQNTLPVTAQRKAVLSATAYQTTAVVFHIGIDVGKKTLRQIGQVHIFQHDTLILQ